MALDIRGGLKNTYMSTNKYVVIDELFSNAIDSYLIRRAVEKSVPNLNIELEFDIISNSLLLDEHDLIVRCIDNGFGFGEEQVRAFVTKDSTFKDHLDIKGIGKCKGAGRIQFFHFFRKLNIDSICSDGTFNRKKLLINENTREISESDFKCDIDTDSEIKTIVTLSGLSDHARKKFFPEGGLHYDFSAKAIRDYLFIAFLQRLLIIKNIIGDFNVKVTSKLNDSIESECICSTDLPEPSSRTSILLNCTHGHNYDGDKLLNVSRYSFPKTSIISLEHDVALCANSAVVKSLIKHYLKNTHERKTPIDDKFELILVESSYLEGKVNEQRDGFLIPDDCVHGGYFNAEYSLADIISSLEDYIYEVLTPSDFDRDELINITGDRFGISKEMIFSTNIKIRYTDTPSSIAKRVLKKYQDEIVDETSDIFDLKKELVGLDPRDASFRSKVSEISWKYTSTIKKMDMANLSQLVVRRASMIEVLGYALGAMLDCQRTQEHRIEHEKIIHNIFFPTGKDNRETIDHDIWILNEEYHYFEHIASDKPLSSIPWNDRGEFVFENDIDISLESLFTHNNKEHRLKRPDIAIFNQEGAAIIIEFKAPGVYIQEHVNDLVQYARLLAAKSNGKINKFYGYLIGDSLDESRIPPNYKPFAGGKGYFSTDMIFEPTSRVVYGELHSEMLLYNDFLIRAKNRLEIYKKKLNLDI
ncbi:hypothetical protein [Aeromonas allosaccharophila]|uniref:hypothetical protein n=1 Tax=Aeromonas allosaccharophila TaxID=656 RepID=UPI00398818F3